MLVFVVQILVSLAKDEPDTNLKTLMKQEGAKKIRDAMKTYISTLKTGM